MPSSTTPKALLFDIGGVCVISPMRAILDYEIAHSIPPGWVNFSISRSSPNGYWHRLERGEIPLDAAFYAGFNADLRNPSLWRQHHARSASKGAFDVSAKTAASYQKQAHAAPAVAVSAAGTADAVVDNGVVPPMPEVDGEWLFNEMMSKSRQPDPHMAPALRKLKASGKFLLGALSNTVIFPEGHPYYTEQIGGGIRETFDVFVSSAHTGLRKPDPKVYALALEMMREKRPDLEPGDVVFLDDIGENLKGGKKAGFRTIKVQLGYTQGAVKQLEEVTGLDLLEPGVKL